jgi:large subunit ribosomal protein L24
MKGSVGGFQDKDMPINVSNVALFNTIASKGDRVGIKTLEDGRQVRFFKSNGEVVDA